MDIKRYVFSFFLILVTQKFIDFFPIRRIKSLKKKTLDISIFCMGKKISKVWWGDFRENIHHSGSYFNFFKTIFQIRTVNELSCTLLYLSDEGCMFFWIIIIFNYSLKTGLLEFCLDNEGNCENLLYFKVSKSFIYSFLIWDVHLNSGLHTFIKISWGIYILCTMYICLVLVRVKLFGTFFNAQILLPISKFSLIYFKEDLTIFLKFLNSFKVLLFSVNHFKSLFRVLCRFRYRLLK